LSCCGRSTAGGLTQLGRCRGARAAARCGLSSGGSGEFSPPAVADRGSVSRLGCPGFVHTYSLVSSVLGCGTRCRADDWHGTAAAASGRASGATSDLWQCDVPPGGWNVICRAGKRGVRPPVHSPASAHPPAPASPSAGVCSPTVCPLTHQPPGQRAVRAVRRYPMEWGSRRCQTSREMKGGNTLLANSPYKHPFTNNLNQSWTAVYISKCLESCCVLQ
jgi:hypothetical protein